MAAWEDPKLTFSHGHNSTATYGSEKDPKTSRTASLQQLIKGSHQGKQEIQSQSLTNTPPPARQASLGSNFTIWRFSLRNEGFVPHIKYPNPRDLHQRHKPPKHLALKTNMAYIQETPRT